jgi:hypothetical protein
MEIVENSDENTSNQRIINLRNRFAYFIQHLVEGDVEIAIDSFINHMNNNPNQNSVVLKYGGRSWNNIVYNEFGEQTAEFNDVQKISFLKGNYDIFMFANSHVEFKSFNGIITHFISKIEELFKRQFEIMCNSGNESGDELKKYEIVSHRSSDEKPECHTISCGYYYHIMLKQKNSEVSEHYEIMVPGQEYKSLFYFECSAFPVKNLDLFRQTMVFAQNPTFVSKFGLFFFSSLLLTDRNKEKGISIDEIRKQFMDNIILPAILVEFRMNDIVNFMKHIFLDFYDEIFFLNPSHEFDLSKSITFYKNYQSKIILAAFEKYDAQVIFSGKRIHYVEFIKQFNDALLDSRCGGRTKMEDSSKSPDFQNYPSFRQIINWILICVNVYLQEEKNGIMRFEKSGGDAMRYYLPDELQHTVDIDTKLFYTSSKKITPVQNKIILIVIFLIIYMEKNRYFRFDETVGVQFGDEEFTLVFDTWRQDNVLSCRFLRDFFVPLLSMDLRLNFSIRRIRTGGWFSSKYTNAILDIGFNMSDKKTIQEKHDFFRHIPIPPDFPHDIISGIIKTIYVSKNQQQVILLTPLPTVSYLIEDIEKMYKDETSRQARITAGKYTKDVDRHEKLTRLHASGQRRDLAHDVIDKLEQIEQMNNAKFIEQKNKLYMFCEDLLSIPDDNFKFDTNTVDLTIMKLLPPLTRNIVHYFENEYTIQPETYTGQSVEDILLFSLFLISKTVLNKKLPFSNFKRKEIVENTLNEIGQINDARNSRKESLRRSTRSTKRGGTKKYKRDRKDRKDRSKHINKTKMKTLRKTRKHRNQ